MRTEHGVEYSRQNPPVAGSVWIELTSASGRSPFDLLQPHCLACHWRGELFGQLVPAEARAHGHAVLCPRNEPRPRRFGRLICRFRSRHTYASTVDLHAVSEGVVAMRRACGRCDHAEWTIGVDVP